MSTCTAWPAVSIYWSDHSFALVLGDPPLDQSLHVVCEHCPDYKFFPHYTSSSSSDCYFKFTATDRMQCISTEGSTNFHADISVGRQVDGTLHWHRQGVGVVLCKGARNSSLTNRQSYWWNPAACGGNLMCIRVALQNSLPQTYKNLQKHNNISRTGWRLTRFTNNLWHNLLNSSGLQRVQNQLFCRELLCWCTLNQHLISESP